MLDLVRVNLMKMMSDRREKSMDWTTRLCLHYNNLLSETIELGRTMKLIHSSENVFAVQLTRTYQVDLSQIFCSCNMWKINGFPCKYGVACIIGTGQDVYKFCESFFFIESFRASYSLLVEPVLMDERLDEIPDDPTMLPPTTKPGPRRPKKKRIKSAREKRNATITNSY
ncbi:zinc finger protein [Macleaya cordata]|uniref:Zinc finger protein n=1 Tax=Macleaya cordata TaxID=56857 RepID=A0A200QL65_MACCD|nr:zinc finger protein [Macleaya cordata]